MLTTKDRVQNYRWQKIDRVHRGRDIPLTESRNLCYDGRLTPRQRRRVVKKLLRQTRVRLTEQERLEYAAYDLGMTLGLVAGDMTPLAESHDAEMATKDAENEFHQSYAECPTCLATGDSPCVTKSGAKARKSHANRPVAV